MEGEDELSSKSVSVIPERYSIAFFCNANKDVDLEPLRLGAKFAKAGVHPKKAKYETINALDYLTQRLSETIDAGATSA